MNFNHFVPLSWTNDRDKTLESTSSCSGLSV
jgi:hypothetical protein